MNSQLSRFSGFCCLDCCLFLYIFVSYVMGIVYVKVHPYDENFVVQNLYSSNSTFNSILFSLFLTKFIFNHKTSLNCFVTPMIPRITLVSYFKKTGCVVCKFTLFWSIHVYSFDFFTTTFANTFWLPQGISYNIWWEGSAFSPHSYHLWEGTMCLTCAKELFEQVSSSLL